MSKFFSGSEWRKWDLHVHTPSSMLNNQFPKLEGGTPDWEQYIDTLEKLEDIAVLGITDYFTIEGYKEILKQRQAGKIKNIQTILPNIEFRLSNVVASKKDGKNPRRLNLHVIFSNELRPETIEDHFLHELWITVEGNPQFRDYKEKLKPSNLEELGSQIKAENPTSYPGKSDIEVGAAVAVVDHNHITELLTTSNRFKGKYLIVLDEEYIDLIEWGRQDHNIRRILMQKTDMLFTSNKNTINWCLGKAYETPEQFIEEFKSLKPCIHGSDAHQLWEIGHPCSKRSDDSHSCLDNPDECDMRYCWIKADPTFEGLKQLLFEPYERVRIQATDPTPSRSNYTIKNIKINPCVIKEDELAIQETILPLHASLVAVTGGKGAGKTALVDLIANCFINRVGSSDKNSFVSRITDSDSPCLNTTLSFKNAQDFTKSVDETDNLIKQSQVSYISQGELEEYISENSDLAGKIRNLIFESKAVRNTRSEYEYTTLDSQIEALKTDIELISSQIIMLERETAQNLANNNDEKQAVVEEEIRDLERKIQEAEKTTNNEIIDEAKKQQEVISKLKSTRDKFDDLDRKISQAKRIANVEFVKFDSLIDDINSLKDADLYKPTIK